MESIRFWVLDVARGGPEDVELWGLSEDGRRIVVKAPFRAFFYLVPSRGGVNIPTAHEVVKLSRRRLGRLVECLKVVVRGNVDHERLAEKLAREGLGEAYGYDIRFSDQYLISSGVSPASWVEAEVEPGGVLNGYEVYKAVGGLRNVGIDKPPELRVMSFNPVYLPAQASPRPERDPVVAISVCNGRGPRTITGDEEDVLRGFVDVVNNEDPDVIVGFQSNRVHWWYLLERARLKGVKLAVGRGRGEPHGSLYGHVSIRGRCNIDVVEFADEVPEIKLETLEEICRHLGVSGPSEVIEEFEVRELWGSRSGRDRVLRYSEWRSEALVKVFNSISDYVFSLSSITGIPPDHVLTAATGFKVENYLMRFAERVVGELIPPRREARHVRYPGGMVIRPRPGLHSDIAVLDFKSMYPNLMIKYNLSIETVREDGSIVGSSEPGFLPRALKHLIDERGRVVEELKRASPDKVRVLDAKQKALKRIANAVYGYTGWSGARWYAPHVAASITAKGRETISRVVGKAKELGLDVIYGDTDSVFVSYKEEAVGKLLEWVESSLGLEVKLEKVYKKVLFTEAKKRYAGVTTDGRIDVVGLEAVRGDWSEAAKQAQVEVLEVLLRTGDVRRAESVAKEWVDKCRRGEIPLKKLIIWKQITRQLHEYEATAPHVLVAKELINSGWSIKPGDKVGYVVVKGPGKLHEKVRPYFMVRPEDVDLSYYAEKQIAPACARVLGVLGVTEARILAPARMESLDAFFGG